MNKKILFIIVTLITLIESSSLSSTPAELNNLKALKTLLIKSQNMTQEELKASLQDCQNIYNYNVLNTKVRREAQRLLQKIQRLIDPNHNPNLIVQH